MTLEQVKEMMGMGFNCAQIVFASAAEELGMDKETALKTAAAFGSGMGCGEVCGAVAGGLMAVGCKYGNFAAGQADAKAICGAKAAEFKAAFCDEYEFLRCKDILGYDFSIPEQAAEIKEKGITAQICPQLIAYATEVLKDVL